MTLVQIAKDGPTGSIRKMREIESTFFRGRWKEKVSWLRLVARPLELELEKEMSIEKHWKQMYLVYIRAIL
jgi:hypothetical protein